jgi:uncharacterized membrane protein
MRPVRGDGGQVTAFVVVTLLTMVMFAGLVLDGGRLLAGRRRAADVADAAARAAAQAVSVDALRAPSNGQLLVQIEARQLALAYVARSGMTGEVVVRGDAVTVTVADEVPMLILGLGGVWSLEVTGTGSARTVRGIEGAGDGP